MKNSPQPRLTGAPLALCAALSALLVSPRLEADEPTLQETTYRPEEKPARGTRWRLVLGGAALASGWYAANVGASQLWKNAPNAESWRIPVVGPWLSLGDARCGAEEESCGRIEVVGRTGLTLASSVAQLGGIALMLEGLLVDERPEVAQGLRLRHAAVGPLPLGGTGIQLRGSF